MTKYGMSDKVGMMYIEDKGSGGGGSGGGSDVESEVKNLLSNSYERAKNCLVTNRDQLEAVAKGLIEYESLSGSEVVDLINGREIPKSHHKRSQKPSRDIAPIKNRPRPNIPTPPGVSDTSAGSQKRPIKRPVRKPISVVPSPSVTEPPKGPKRVWGNADANSPGSSHMNNLTQNNNTATTADADTTTSTTGWMSSVKGWFGFGDSKTKETVEHVAENVAKNKDNVNSNAPGHVKEKSPSLKNHLPSTVGPPVEKIPAGATLPQAQKRQTAVLSPVEKKIGTGEKPLEDETAKKALSSPKNISKKEQQLLSPPISKNGGIESTDRRSSQNNSKPEPAKENTKKTTADDSNNDRSNK